MNARTGNWPIGCAIVGAILWLAIKLVPTRDDVGIGSIEWLFLFAPLVLMPLALASLRGNNSRAPLLRTTIHAQPVATALAIVSFLLPAGLVPMLLALPWAMLTFAVGVAGLADFAKTRLRNPPHLLDSAAMLMLPVGGIGLLQSRFGAAPLGFHEPLVLLVAVHFHYAAFLAPIVVARGLNEWTQHHRPFAWALAACVVTGSPLMALGFVVHQPWMRTVAAFILGGALAAFAVITLVRLPRIESRAAQIPLAISALAIVASMWLAVIYTLGDLRGEVWISIPQMARTHGLLNAFGFSLCGLIGWTLVQRAKERQPTRLNTFHRRPQTLLSRWE